ncbi:MAG: hypothetical protein Q4G28_09610 [Neisseria sp.]|nr:hypothetical protein [Neisseria sp.]
MEKWIPACAGMTDGMDISKKKVFCKGLSLLIFSDSKKANINQKIMHFQG